MSNKFKISILFLMTLSLMFGFMHLFFPLYNFQRLHIFLFNLVSGGTIILYYTEKKTYLTNRTMIYCFLAMAYSICAFLSWYLISIVLAILLCAIVEWVRIDTFSWFPKEFFQKQINVNDKFQQASLLCLSIGLAFSALAIINQEFIIFLPSEKFKLNTFFLGFSFPLSLITFSLIFKFMQKTQKPVLCFLKKASFWTLNLGVIIFFIFILLGSWIMEFVVSLVLLSTVCFILYLQITHGSQKQQKILISGLCFLILTSVSGLLYITYYLISNHHDNDLTMRLHTMFSLYGWNLSGLLVISRLNDFPSQFKGQGMIYFHWAIVLFFAPMGYYSILFAIIATILFALFLALFLFIPTRSLK